MNYIVLEGVSLYLFLTFLLLLVIIAVCSLVFVVCTDRKNFVLSEFIAKEHAKVKMLVKENFILKLKHGEIDINDE